MGVLEACGLVRSTQKGRVRTDPLTPKALAPAKHWLKRQRNLREKRLDPLDQVLLELEE